MPGHGADSTPRAPAGGRGCGRGAPFDVVVQGQLWVDGTVGKCVRAGHSFYPLAVGVRFPPHSREYDPVTVRLRSEGDARVVVGFLGHVADDAVMTRHPHGFPLEGRDGDAVA